MDKMGCRSAMELSKRYWHWKCQRAILSQPITVAVPPVPTSVEYDPVEVFEE